MVVDDPTQTEKMPILGAAARSTLCMTYSMLDDDLTYSMVCLVSLIPGFGLARSGARVRRWMSTDGLGENADAMDKKKSRLRILCPL